MFTSSAAEETRLIRCALLAPKGAGVSTFCQALQQLPSSSHSFGKGLSATIGPISEPLSVLSDDLHGNLQDELQEEGQPEIPPVRLTPDRISAKLFEASFSCDAPIGSLSASEINTVRFEFLRPNIEDPLSREEIKELLSCEAVMVFAPIDAPAPSQKDREALRARLKLLRAGPKDQGRLLIAALTKYERRFAALGRSAYAAAAEQRFARAAIRETLNGPARWLADEMRAHEKERAGPVLAQPLSSFGFVPLNGAANLDPSPGPAGDRPRLRAPHDDAALSLDAPYTQAAISDYYWRPFLTLDPLITIAAAAPGALCFGSDEMLEE